MPEHVSQTSYLVGRSGCLGGVREKVLIFLGAQLSLQKPKDNINGIYRVSERGLSPESCIYVFTATAYLVKRSGVARRHPSVKESV